MKLKYLIPLVLFFVLVGFLTIGLKLDPRDVPSPLVGKAAPEFSLPVLSEPGKTMGPEQMKGKVWLLNVWASWCVSCRAEHPILIQWAENMSINLVGLNYKDQDPAAEQWLAKLGNPYSYSVTDTDGRVGIDWGVYGVPETFVIDKKGMIRYKKTGPVTVQDVKDTFIPLIQQLESES